MANNKEEWKEVIDGMEPKGDSISLSRSWLKSFITNLLRTEREKATTEAAQHYALGREHGRDFAYIEVREIVEEMKVRPWAIDPPGGIGYNLALNHLLTKLEEKEGI